MVRASTSRYAIVLPSRLMLIEYCTDAPLPTRAALPVSSATRTIGISNICAPAANVPSFMVTKSDWLSRAHIVSAIHAPFIG